VHFAREGVRLSTHPGEKLEAEANLEVDDSRSERARRLAKVGVSNVSRQAAGVNVQQVEGVEHVGLDFEVGVFSEDRNPGQAEALGNVQIDVTVSRTGKLVAAASRSRDECTCDLSWIVGDRIRVVRNFKIVIDELIVVRASVCGAGVGEIATCLEGAVVRVTQSLAIVVGAQVLEPIVTGEAIDLVRSLIDGRPPIAGVKGHDATERPAASDLLSPVIASMKENRLPDTK